MKCDYTYSDHKLCMVLSEKVSPKLLLLQVLDALKVKGIAIRVASPKLVMEEAPESYKVCSQQYSALMSHTCMTSTQPPRSSADEEHVHFEIACLEVF